MSPISRPTSTVLPRPQAASPDLKGDRGFVLEAVLRNGWALAYAADSLRRDQEVVLAAVQQSPPAMPLVVRIVCLCRSGFNAFRLATQSVFEDVPTPGGAWAFSHAADELKADREFALQAVRRNQASQPTSF